MDRCIDVKVCRAWLARAAGMICTTVVVICPLQGKVSYQPRDCSPIYCASVADKTLSPSDSDRLADDYCNTRCDQQFNYCQYRGESRDYCARLLINCRRNC